MKGRPSRLGLFAALAFTAGFAAWAVYILVARWSELPVVEWRWGAVAAAAALTLAVIGINSLMVDYAASRVGRGLGAWPAQRLGVVVTLVNYFMPLRAGLALRLLHYVRISGHDAVQLGSALFASALVVQAVGAAVLLLAVATVKVIPWEIAWVAVAAGLALAVAAWLAGSAGAWRGLAITGLVARIQTGGRALLQGGFSPAGWVAALALLGLLATAWRYQVVLAMVQEDVSIAIALALAAGTGLSTLLSVTFGGLGVRETAMVLVGTLCGVEPETCLMLAILDRAIVSATLAAVGIPLLSGVNRALASDRP